MVTEGLQNPCSVCFDDSSSTPDAQPKSALDASPPSGVPTSSLPSQSPAAALNDALRQLHVARSASVPADKNHAQASRAAGGGVASASALDDSPRLAFQQQSRRDSGFRRTYDETVTKKQGPCDNCAMTLPRRQASAAASANHFPLDTQGPTLRTRTPIERVFGAAEQASPPSSQTSSDSDGNVEATRHARNRRAAPTASSRTTSCSSTSTSSDRSAYHFHYINYTSTHEPIRADSSLVRASCLRALSFETLPRAPSTSTPTSSPQLNHSSSFVTTQSAGSAATGGAIFFGDAMAGYTTAYIFRIPDLHARGHKRVYAFLALSTHKERLAMKTFVMVSAAFRDLATWIQQLAEAEAERARESSPIGSALHGGAWVPPPSMSGLDVPAAGGGSSFLTGGSGFARRMGGPGGTSSLKSRGLAELVGQPDFFIELHGKFIRLLLEVGVALSS